MHYSFDQSGACPDSRRFRALSASSCIVATFAGERVLQHSHIKVGCALNTRNSPSGVHVYMYSSWGTERDCNKTPSLGRTQYAIKKIEFRGKKSKTG